MISRLYVLFMDAQLNFVSLTKVSSLKLGLDNSRRLAHEVLDLASQSLT
jgi:hypothetical protein